MGTLSGTNGRTKQASKSSPPSFRFLNYSLNRKDIEWLEASDVDVDLPDTLVDELVTQGYKYSLSYDAGNVTYVAAVTDRSPDSAFQNVCLTGRGATPRDARVSLLYRHYVASAEDWAVLDSGSTATRNKYD